MTRFYSAISGRPIQGIDNSTIVIPKESSNFLWIQGDHNLIVGYTKKGKSITIHSIVNLHKGSLYPQKKLTEVTAEIAKPIVVALSNQALRLLKEVK